MPNNVLPDAVSSERLEGNWHRVTFDMPPAFFYIGLLQILAVLTVVSGAVVVPVALGVLRLGRPRTG